MITDEQALEYIKELNLYCLEHQCCEGCIFKPVNYKPETNECLLQSMPPTDVYSKLKYEFNK